jgi:hypothetical protein
LCVFLWAKVLNEKDIHKEMLPVYCGKCLLRKAVHSRVEKFFKGLSKVRPILLYGATAWGCAAKSNMKNLQIIQNKIIRSIYDGDRYTSNILIHIALDVRTLNEEIKRASAKLYQRIRQHDVPIIAAHPRTLLIHQTKADITLTDHTCRQPTSDALVMLQHLTTRATPD